MVDLEKAYQSTQVDESVSHYGVGEEEEFELASPWKRIGANIINSLISLVAYIPMIWGAVSMSSSFEALDSPEGVSISGFGMGMMGLGFVLLLVYLIGQAILMSKTGQSLGKRLLRIKVVNAEGDNPGFVGVVLLREIVPNLGLLVVSLIPFVGSFVQLGFWAACLVMLFLVSSNRQTLQDLIAKTYVVDAD